MDRTAQVIDNMGGLLCPQEAFSSCTCLGARRTFGGGPCNGPSVKRWSTEGVFSKGRRTTIHLCNRVEYYRWDPAWPTSRRAFILQTVAYKRIIEKLLRQRNERQRFLSALLANSGDPPCLSRRRRPTGGHGCYMPAGQEGRARAGW
jgi:hypothetical protein